MEHPSLKEHIFNLEKKLMAYEDLNDLLADDFLEFGSSGNTFNKKAIQDAALHEKNIQFTVTDFNIKLLSADVVLATYRTFRQYDRKHALRSSIWKVIDGQWKMVFHQGTPTV